MTDRNHNADQLYSDAKNGDRRALGRLISLIESGYLFKLNQVKSHPGAQNGPVLVGITGAPGAGKSTLTSQIISSIRSANETVAVIAIDPSSPFTGGAILGDRIRMSEHALDSGVYIRSFATRGKLGGLASAVPEVVKLLSSLLYNFVLIETVGVGQIEVEIVGQADTTVVVVNPGWGDSVQANKAGLMEIADIFVINKSDRPGANETERDLKAMLELSSNLDWIPPICQTVSTEGQGVDTLLEKIKEHRSYLEKTGILQQKLVQRTKNEILSLINERIVLKTNEFVDSKFGNELIDSVIDGNLDVFAASEIVLGEINKVI